MRKSLLIIGIILIAACMLSLAFAVLSRFGYYHALDGSPELYARLRHRMAVFGIAGIILAAAGAACFFIRSRM